MNEIAFNSYHSRSEEVPVANHKIAAARNTIVPALLGREFLFLLSILAVYHVLPKRDLEEQPIIDWRPAF